MIGMEEVYRRIRFGKIWWYFNPSTPGIGKFRCRIGTVTRVPEPATTMATDLENKAKEAFIDDHFESAVHLYSHAIHLNPNNAQLYSDRAQANIKLSNFTEAVADANRAIELDSSLAKAYLRKGIAFMKLEEYQTAENVFQAGAALAHEDSRFTNYIRECDQHIADCGGNGVTRSNHWIREEDEILVSAWLNTSYDVTKGDNQKVAAFWTRIHDYFEKVRKVKKCKKNVQRSWSMCKSRWQKLSLHTNKFAVAFGIATQHLISGQTEADYLWQAHTIYTELDDKGRRFAFEHAWRILRNQEKWKTYAKETYNVIQHSSKRSKSSSGAAISVDSDVEPVVGTNEESILCPLVRDAKKRKGIAQDGSAESALQTQTIQEGIQIMQGIREEDRRRNDSLEKLIALKETDLDMKILSIDISTIKDELQQDYVLKKRGEILKKVRIISK